MTEFDLPDCTFSVPRRARTTTPLQALTLLNHSFTLDMAEAFAERLRAFAPEQRVEEAFRIAFQRPPTEDERSRAEAAAETSGLRALCRAILNSSELIYLD